MTLWQYRLFIFTPPTLNIGQKTAIAAIFANNGSGETLQNEVKMFDHPVLFSPTGNEPATVWGFNTPVTVQIRDGLFTALESITGATYYCINAVPPDEDELIATNSGQALGQIWTWDDSVTDQGLIEIEAEDV